LIVGETTFGKGLVQTVFPLSENTGLLLTTARYYTPSGRLIQRDYSSVSLYDYYYNREQEENPPNKEVRLTDSGRTVFGGGGITPDVKIPAIKTTRFEDSLLIKYAFFNFGAYYLNGRTIDKNFQVTDAVMQEFRKFLDAQKIPHTEADLTEGMDWIKAQIKAELFISQFGQQEGMKVRAEADPQVISALSDLPKAKELADTAKHVLAQRTAASTTR
jgi:carboxyl-terminal processing protease